MKHNIRKDKSGKFTMGGYARCRGWGTRVYKVFNVFTAGVTVKATGKWEERTYVTLSKAFETNRGRPIFTNSRPFTVHSGYDGTLHWYYPAKAI